MKKNTIKNKANAFCILNIVAKEAAVKNNKSSNNYDIKRDLINFY